MRFVAGGCTVELRTTELDLLTLAELGHDSIRHRLLLQQESKPGFLPVSHAQIAKDDWYRRLEL